MIKYFIRIIAGLLIPIISYVLIGIVLSMIGTNPPQIACENKQEIYITSNGVHLDILFPKELLEKDFLKALNLPAQVNYVSFGWGDKAFYLETPTWDQFKLSVAMRALFLKSETAMHVTCYRNKRKEWNRVKICEKQREQLLEYVMSSFKKEHEGQLTEIKNAGYTKDDKFYEAIGNYSFIMTCNNWVNAGLKQADIKTSLWSPFDFGVLYHLEKASSKEKMNRQ